MIPDWLFYWRRYRPRPRRWLIDLLSALLEWACDDLGDPQPEMVERAKAKETHHFAIRAVWEPEGIPGGCWMAYISGDLEGFTQGKDLPDVLSMAGDWLKINAQYAMHVGLYPPLVPPGVTGVYDGRTGQFYMNPNPPNGVIFHQN